MLKGWDDRGFLPEVAFHMPDADHHNIRPGLRQILQPGILNTCGASWWLTQIIGAPGKRTLARVVGILCQPGKRKTFVAHYRMDSLTPESRTWRGRTVRWIG